MWACVTEWTGKWGHAKKPHENSGWIQPGLQLTPPSLPKSFKKCSISKDLDGMEDDVSWAEQYDKSDTDSDEEGDDMYDDTWTDTIDVEWRDWWWWWWWILGFWINIADNLLIIVLLIPVFDSGCFLSMELVCSLIKVTVTSNAQMFFFLYLHKLDSIIQRLLHNSSKHRIKVIQFAYISTAPVVYDLLQQVMYKCSCLLPSLLKAWLTLLL